MKKIIQNHSKSFKIIGTHKPRKFAFLLAKFLIGKPLQSEYVESE